MWYVVQTLSGQEEQVCDLIKQAVGDTDLLRECFVPCYEIERKFHGEWKLLTKILFPGYLIVVTNQVDRLSTALNQVRAFTKLLGSECAFVPLDRAEMAWIGAFTTHKRRVIGMSRGVMEGDRVVVTEGALVGHEFWIKRIDRRKSTAYVEMKMFGRTIETKLGLAILARKPAQN